MADASAEAIDSGFARLTAFLRQDNSQDSQQRRTSQKMMQKGDTQVTMWVRRTAVAIENVEKMFKAFLTDAQIRQNQMMEMMNEAARAGGGKGIGGADNQSGAGKGDKIDWKSGLAKLGGWKLLFAGMLAGIGLWLKDLFSSSDWGKKLGLEDASTMIGKLLGGSQKGGWLSAFAGAGKFGLIGATMGMKGGLLGMLAGALLGAAVGGIVGWIGAEKIAKGVDYIYKSILRSLGLSTNTTPEVAEEAQKAAGQALKNFQDAQKVTKAAKEALDAIEDKKSQEYLAANMAYQKALKLEKEAMEANAAARTQSAELQLDLLRAARNKLTDQRTEIKQDDAESIRRLVYLNRRKKSLERVEARRKKNGKSLTAAEEQELLAVRTEIAEKAARMKINEKRLLELEEPIAAAEDKLKKFTATMKQDGTMGYSTGFNTAVNDAADAISNSFRDISSWWKGKSAEMIAEDLAAWKTQKETMRKNRKLVKGLDRVVDGAQKKFDTYVDRILDKRMKADDPRRDAERKKIIEGASTSRDDGLRLRQKSLNNAIGQRDKLLGGADATRQKMDSMFNQYNTHLKEKGKGPVTREAFDKLMDSASEKFKKDSVLPTINYTSSKAAVTGNAISNEAAQPSVVMANVVQQGATNVSPTTVIGGGNGGSPPIVKASAQLTARPDAAFKAAGVKVVIADRSFA